MMCNKKSTKWAVLKYMYLLPVGAFATVAFARPEIVNGVDGRLEQLSAVKVTDLSATAKAVAAENVQPEPLKWENGFQSGSLRGESLQAFFGCGEGRFGRCLFGKDARRYCGESDGTSE